MWSANRPISGGAFSTQHRVSGSTATRPAHAGNGFQETPKGLRAGAIGLGHADQQSAHQSV
ncbi:MAG: hypothetical protein CMK00_08475 [Planctomycetes bacterium]|nr:hypothetical protein [Planctomycetota bacterium]